MNSLKSKAPIFALVLFALGVGYTFAHNKTVVIPLGGDSSSSLGFYDGEVSGSHDVSSLQTLAGVSFTASTGGTVIVNTTVLAAEGTMGDRINCYITDTESTTLGAPLQSWSSYGPGAVGQISGTRGFNVSAGETKSYYLRCEHVQSGAAVLSHPWITAIFNPYS